MHVLQEAFLVSLLGVELQHNAVLIRVRAVVVGFSFDSTILTTSLRCSALFNQLVRIFWLLLRHGRIGCAQKTTVALHSKAVPLIEVKISASYAASLS